LDRIATHALQGGSVAWMRMMEADSVAYHRATVLGRGDGAAVVRRRSASKARLPTSSTRRSSGSTAHTIPPRGSVWSTTKRPQLELVISPHKSVAELGVIGRADDMLRSGRSHTVEPVKDAVDGIDDQFQARVC
jgi:hypothetical protein